MRVVHVVCTDAFAGVERYVADAASGLDRRGLDVVVIGGDPKRMRSELAPGVSHVPARGVAQAVRALLRQGRADIVHAHMSHAEIAAVSTRAVHRGRVVSTRHFAAPRGSRGWSRAPLSLAARAITAEIAISNFVAESLDRDCLVIPNGVRLADGAATRKRTVLVLQRLEREKDTEVALHAWLRSGLASEDWRLQIAGRGSQDRYLRSLAAHLELQSVEWLGYVERPESLLSSAGALLATAPAEPFGLAVVEAMAHGTPVVAAAGGAHLETLGPEGLTFVPGDPVGAAKALRRLSDGNFDVSDYGRRLQERQRRQFDLDSHVDRLVASYDQILGWSHSTNSTRR